MTEARPTGRGRTRPARAMAWTGALVLGAALLGWGITRVLEWQRHQPALRHYNRGLELHRGGDLDAALGEWHTATELEPAWTEPYFRLAELLPQIGERDLAVQVLLRAHAANPKARHVLCRLAEACVQAEDPGASRKYSADAVAREPGCARAHTAFALARRSDLGVAAKHLQRAHELEPRDPQILLTLARLYVHSGDVKEGQETLARVLALTPHNAETHYLSGALLVSRARDPQSFKEAEGHLQEAIRLEPERFDAYAQLGILYTRQRQWSKALPYLEAARKRNPYSPGVRYQLATAYRQTGDPRAAAEWEGLRKLQDGTKRWTALQKQLVLHPENLSLAVEAAEVSLDVGAHHAALRLASAVLARDPENKRARRVLDRIQSTSAAPGDSRP